jgi:hypothetical protein
MDCKKVLRAFARYNSSHLNQTLYRDHEICFMSTCYLQRSLQDIIVVPFALPR